MAIARTKRNRRAVHTDNKVQTPQPARITALRLRVIPRTCSFRFNAWWRLSLTRLETRCCLLSAVGGGHPPTSSSIDANVVGFPSSNVAVDPTPVDTCLGLRNMGTFVLFSLPWISSKDTEQTTNKNWLPAGLLQLCVNPGRCSRPHGAPGAHNLGRQQLPPRTFPWMIERAVVTTSLFGRLPQQIVVCRKGTKEGVILFPAFSVTDGKNDPQVPQWRFPAESLRRK